MKLTPSLILILLALIASGCTSTNSSLTSYIPFYPQEDAKSDQLPPSRVVAVWAPDVLQTIGTSATQGFGGRLFFFDNKNKAVEVEGQLVVYAFDDTNLDDNEIGPSKRPDRRFVFTSEQVPNHFSENKIGPSYSFWIPWQQAAGQTRKTITLMPVFTTTDGVRVAGPPTRNVLPGKRPDRKAIATDVNRMPSPDDLRQVMNEVQLRQQDRTLVKGDQPPPVSKRAITTITMPRNMARTYNHTRPITGTQRRSLEDIQGFRENYPAGTAGGTQSRATTPQLPVLPQLPQIPITPSTDSSWKPTLRPSSLPPSAPSPTARVFPTSRVFPTR